MARSETWHCHDTAKEDEQFAKDLINAIQDGSFVKAGEAFLSAFEKAFETPKPPEERK